MYFKESSILFNMVIGEVIEISIVYYPNGRYSNKYSSKSAA